MHRELSIAPIQGAVTLLFTLSLLAGCNNNSPPAAIDDPSLPSIDSYQPGARPAIKAQPTIERSSPGSSEISPSRATENSVSEKPALPIPDLPPTPVYRPIVAMSDAHADTCLVKVGDTMPELTLLHNNGQEFLLSQLYGQKLTVVLFWNQELVFAREQFTRLGWETAEPFTRYGVSVVAVNVGDSPQDVSSLDIQYGQNFSSLMDIDDRAFEQVATDKLPRAYLLDPQGRILWFDIEYSLSTARQLRNALQFHLQQSD